MEYATVQKTSRFSRLKVGIAAVAIGALLVVPASANDRSEDMSIEVAPGEHTLALSEVAALNGGDEITYSPNAQQVDGTLNLAIVDYSGVDANWSVNMVASNFQPEDWQAEEPEISASELHIVDFGEFNLEDGSTDDLATGGTQEGLDVARDIVTATDYAGGEFNVDINLELNVPGATPSDTYGSTITVDSTQAPS